MKVILFLFLIISVINAKEGMKNITLNTLDSDEVVKKVAQRVEQIKLDNLSNSDYEIHKKNINLLQDDVLSIIKLKQDLRESELLLKEKKEKYNKHKNSYEKKMEKIYRSSKHIKRVTYYLISHDIDKDHTTDLQNHLLDKYAVTKFEQSMVIKETSTGSSSFKNVITTKKEFGQMQIDTLKDFTFRDKNLNFKLVKVTQSPFVESTTNKFIKSIDSDIDKFADESGVKILELSSKGSSPKDFVSSYGIDANDIKAVVSGVNKNVNIKKAIKKLNGSSKQINKILKKIEKTHDTQAIKSNQYANSINVALTRVESDTKKLQDRFASANKIAKDYNIELNLEDIDKLIIIMPKVYSEYVDLGEEREFILRKTKSYLSKITINNLMQSETLTNYYDIKTKNRDIAKMIEYDSVHIFPFVKGKELGIFMFSIIEIKDKVTQSNYVTKYFKYGKLEFVPVKRGYKTIFAANTEVTLGLMKEFLETNKQNKYFDKYCLQDSVLPENAKDIKNIDAQYYNYPAVCYKIDKIDVIIKWLSKKVGKKLVIPEVDDWSYIASNSNSSDYCWGNQTIEELNEDEVKHENIYYEDGIDTSIEPIKKYGKSILGMYDMCGNVHELVKKNDVYMIKGNSFISYIEKSDAPAMEYADDLSASLGLRVFYIRENAR